MRKMYLENTTMEIYNNVQQTIILLCSTICTFTHYNVLLCQSFCSINPLSPNSDQHQFSPHHICALHHMQVMRI